ncbi:MAG: hypothetical protein ACR2GY_04065 [Phycisphaerales bacterium]
MARIGREGMEAKWTRQAVSARHEEETVVQILAHHRNVARALDDAVAEAVDASVEAGFVDTPVENERRSREEADAVVTRRRHENATCRSLSALLTDEQRSRIGVPDALEIGPPSA